MRYNNKLIFYLLLVIISTKVGADNLKKLHLDVNLVILKNLKKNVILMWLRNILLILEQLTNYIGGYRIYSTSVRKV